MHPKGANRNIVDHAMFSKEGPYLINPELTSNPSVIPKKYKLKNKSIKGKPSLKIDIPNRGDVRRIAGTRPIKVFIYSTHDIILTLLLLIFRVLSLNSEKSGSNNLISAKGYGLSIKIFPIIFS